MTLARTFAALRARRELALIPYLMAGFPTLERSLESMREAARCGADLLEIGVPFSDPIADGPTLQFAGHAALRRRFRLSGLLAELQKHPLGVPTVLMSYLNPLLAYGRSRLFADLRAGGVSGLIVPDMPPEEASEWLGEARGAGVALVFLAAPTTPDDRLEILARLSEGFVYAVSHSGTTGVRDDPPEGLQEYLRRLRRRTDKPVAVGFGLSRAEHIQALHGLADGAVVGSRLVEALRSGEGLTDLIRTFKQATRSPSDVGGHAN